MKTVRSRPYRASLKAVAWRFLELVAKYQSATYDMVLTGDLPLAAERYRCLLFDCKGCTLSRLPEEFYGLDDAAPINLSVRTMIDVVVAAGFLHIRLDNPQSAFACMSAARRLSDFLSKISKHFNMSYEDTCACFFTQRCISWLLSLFGTFIDRTQETFNCCYRGTVRVRG